MEVKFGYKRTEVGVIPQEWRVKAFANLFAFRNGVNADKDSYGHGIRFINVLEPITFSHLYGPEITGRVTLSEAVAASYTVRRGDVLFNRTSETQEEVGLAATYLGVDRVVFGGFVIRGRPIDESLDPIYSGYALRAPFIRSQIAGMGQGAIRANIGQRNLNLVFAPVPPLAEQHAIAGALSDVDALIVSLEQLLAKKRQLKQGALRELLRPKDGWVTTRLDTVATLVNGRAYSITEWEASGTPVIRLQNLTGRGETYYYSNLELAEKQYCHSGDLLFMWSATFGPIIWQGPKAIFHYHIWKIECQPMKLSKRYLYHLLSEITQKLKNSSSSGGTMLHLTKSGMEALDISIPGFGEQTAIAAILSDMDAEISALEAKLAKARDVKQGMMQELLTGRIRLV